MSTLLLEHEPEAASLKVTANAFIVELSDGRSLSVPWTGYPRLLHGTEAERQNWRLLGDEYAIEWPAFDEHIGIEGLLAADAAAKAPHLFNAGSRTGSVRNSAFGWVSIIGDHISIRDWLDRVLRVRPN